MIIPPWAKLAAVAAVLALLFAAGWQVSAWRAGSQRTADAEADVAALVEQMEATRADLQESVNALDAFNASTLTAELRALAEVRATRAALQETRNEIHRTDVGTAGVTADGDRLRLAAYRAATAPTDP